MNDNHVAAKAARHAMKSLHALMPILMMMMMMVMSSKFKIHTNGCRRSSYQFCDEECE